MSIKLKSLSFLVLLSPTLAHALLFEGFFGSIEAGAAFSQAQISHDHHITFPTDGSALVRVEEITGNPAKHSDMTVVGGLALGYSFLLNPHVLIGLEGHIEVQELKMNHAQHIHIPIAGVTADFNTEAELNRKFSLLAKIGWLMCPDTQLYALVGPQWGHFKYNAGGILEVRPIQGGLFTTQLNNQDTSYKIGCLFGLGMEHAISCNGSVSIEYHFDHYGSLGIPREVSGNPSNATPPAGATFHNSVHVNSSTTMLRYNYYFGC